MTGEKDAYDLFWQWALKPHESMLTIDSEIHHAVTSLPREDWRDRAKVNAAVRATADREQARSRRPKAR